MDQYQSDHTIHRKQLPNRKRNPAKRLSPTFEASTRKNTKKVVNLKRDSLRPEKLPNGKDFQCCLCSSTTFNLTKRPYKNRERAIEESSCYCYSCILSNKAKPTKAKLSSKVEDLEAIKKRKEEYIKSCNEFVQTLYESMKNEYVKKLCCPYFQKKACDCIQKYIVTGDESKVETRINDLCNLMKEAESLSKEKCYEIPADHEMRGKIKVGLGSGHRHSDRFMEYVQRKRHILKTEANLCESACKKILNYSNNFLYRKQKTNKMKRNIDRMTVNKNRSRHSSFEDKPCCVRKCNIISSSFKSEIELLVRRSETNPKSVMREMIIGCQNSNSAFSNITFCNAFTARITGLSQSVILKFKRQLRDQSRSKLSRAKSDVDRMTVEDVNNTLKMVDDEKRKILRFEDKLRKRLEDIESSTSYQDPST